MCARSHANKSWWNIRGQLRYVPTKFCRKLPKYVLASESNFWKTVNKHPSDLRVDWKMFAPFFRPGHQIFRGMYIFGRTFFSLPQPNSKPFHRAWLYFTKCAILLQCRPPSVANNLVSFSSKGNLLTMGKVILNRNKTRKMLKCRKKKKSGKDLEIFVVLVFFNL